jgi:hypothetical protein
MSGGNQDVDTSYSREPTFNFPGTEGFAKGLLSRANERLFNPDDQYKEQGQQFYSDVLRGEPIRWRPSDQVTAMMGTIRETADQALPEELANARSQYYRGPAGRSLMGIDDSLVRNRLGRDADINSLLMQQYNQDVGTMFNSANNLVQTDASDFAQAMQVANLLIGEKGKGAQNSSSTASTGSILGGLGGLVGGISGFF